MFSRLALRMLFAVLFVYVLAVLAAPTPLLEEASLEEHSMEKRSSGTMTWFTPGLGHCGGKNNKDDMIIALSTSMYSKGKHCGKKVKIQANGKSVMATVRDSCPPCGNQDIDASPAVFRKLVPQGLGRGVQEVSWSFA